MAGKQSAPMIEPTARHFSASWTAVEPQEAFQRRPRSVGEASSAAVPLFPLARTRAVAIDVIEGAMPWVALVTGFSSSGRARTFPSAARRLFRVRARSSCRLQRVIIKLGVGNATQGGLLMG